MSSLIRNVLADNTQIKYRSNFKMRIKILEVLIIKAKKPNLHNF